MEQPISTHKDCPVCHSKDCFSWYEKGRGYCHGGCGGKWVTTEEYVDSKKKEPSGYTYEGIRGIEPKVAEQYGIVVHTDDKGQPYRYAFKYPHTVKLRDIHDKSKTWVKDLGVGMTEFFGPKINPGSSKRIYITEGEFDAASLYQSMGCTWPVLSLPSASIGDTFVKKHYEYLNSFAEIVYAGELDKAGKKAADRLYKALPNKFYYIPLTKWKDANEAIQKGDQEELKWTALRPQRWTPDNFFCSDDKVAQILREENPYEYVKTGISQFDEVCRGLVKGGITFLMAPPGTGKTEIFRKFEVGLIKNSECKVGLLHMEEVKSTTYRAMATYELGFNVRTKEDAAERGFTEDQVILAAQKAAAGERTVVFEMRGEDDPSEVIHYCRLAAGVYGADYIFIDHIQRLAYLGGVDGATNTLTKIASNLAQLAKELNIGIIIISHVNEDGHTKYAKSLEEEAIVLIKIDRDKDSTDPDIANITRFQVVKNRPFSKLGFAGAVKYNPETTIIEEVIL
jgi:twinkle protein